MLYQTREDESEALIDSLREENAELLSALQGVLPFLTGDYWPGEKADPAVDRAIAITRKAEMTPN